MNDLIDNRHIRIFISSTFRDMQDERDYLMKRTFPRLRDEASRRDVTLTELDLRWGITRKESESGKVVEICLREIENSIPFFIGIIGNRYGWIPDRKDLDANVLRRFPDVNGYLGNRLSVTEMEMQFGVLERQEDMHAYFFIKSQEDTDQDNPERLRRLKDSVKNNGRYPVFSYENVEDLASKVEQAFMGLLESLYPCKALRDIEKENMEQKAFRNGLCQNYIRNENTFRFLDNWLHDPERKALVVTGDSGLGKTALAANWSKHIECHSPEMNIIYYFIGNGSGESSHTYLQKYLCSQINGLYGFDCENLEQVFTAMETGRCKPLLLILDAVNQLADIDDAKLMNWVPPIPSNLKILYTTLKDDRSMSAFKNKGYETFLLHPLDTAERAEMARSYLKRFAKSLGDSQISAIVDSHLCRNTLVLRILLEELINFGIFELLDDKINSYLRQPSIGEFYQKLLENYEIDFSTHMVKEALSLICVSRSGLSEGDIISLTGLRQLEWSQFFCSFRAHMVNKGGLVSFSHSKIKDAVYARYLSEDASYENRCRELLVAHFESGNYPQALDEVPYQLHRLKDTSALHVWFLDVNHTLHTCSRDCNELVQYWKALYDAGYSLSEYRPLLSDPKCVTKPYSTIISLCVEYFSDYDAALSLCDDYALAIENGLDSEDENVEKLYIWQGIIHRSLGRYDQALISFSKARDVICNRRGEDHVNASFALKHIGTIYNEMRDYPKAEDYYIKALEIQKKNNRNKEVIDTIHSLADNCLDAKEYEKAEKFLNDALSMATGLLGNENTTISSLLNSLGALYDMTGRHEESVATSLKGIDLDTRLLGKNHIDLAHSFHNLAGTYYNMGKLKDSEQCYYRAIDIKQRLLGPNAYETTISEAGLGNVKRDLGKYDEAASLHQKYLKAYLDTIGDGPTYVGVILNGIGQDYYLKEDYETALSYHMNALNSIAGKVETIPSPYYNAIGNDLFSLERYQEALLWFEKGIDSAKKENDRFSESIFYNCIGDSYGFLGQYDKALEAFKSAYSIRIALFPEEDSRVKKCKDNIQKAKKFLEG